MGGQQRPLGGQQQMGAPRGGAQGGQRAQGPRAPSGGQQFKYQNNTRNLPQNSGLQQSVPSFQSQQVAPQQGIAVPGQEPLTASMLAEANPQDQKQMLGMTKMSDSLERCDDHMTSI